MPIPRCNQRRSLRARASLQCRYAFRSQNRRARVVDVSEGGAFVACQDPPPAGESVRLEIRSPDGRESVVLEGRVRHNEPNLGGRVKVNGFGVEFGSSPEAVLEWIR